MNGEIFLACNIVTTAKKVLLGENNVKYVPSKYEAPVEFELLQRGILKKKKLIRGVDNWCQNYLSKGIVTIKLLLPGHTNSTKSLAFSGAIPIHIACYHSNGSVYIFTPKSIFLDDIKMWKTTYVEEKANSLSKIPKFINYEQEFLNILVEIEDLAREINADYFANLFLKARQVITEQSTNIISPYNLPLLQLPIENYKLFIAVQYCYVFGGMGTWNDTPSYTALEMNLDCKYNELSQKLYKYIIFSILFAINEW